MVRSSGNGQTEDEDDVSLTDIASRAWVEDAHER